jgi:Holliday junction resolvasome RuvABC endonuclease subunit
VKTLIAGLDASLTGTALLVLGANTDKIFYKRTFANNLTGPTRLAYLKHEILLALQYYRLELKAVFLEDYGFSFRGHDFKLAELGGILRLGIAELEIPLYVIAPACLKLFVTGKGNSKKDIMLEQVFRKYHVGSETLKDDNQVDAYALAKLGMCYLNWKNKKEKLQQKQMASFKKIGEALEIDKTKIKSI